MALSNPVLISAGQSTGDPHGSGSYTTGSLTIPSNCLLIIHVGVLLYGGGFDPSGDLTCSASLGGITPTSVIANGNATSWSLGMRSWYADVTTGGSSTFTFDCGTADVYSYTWSVSYVTGHNTTTPIGPAADTESNVLVTALTLDEAPASTSVIIAAMSGDEVDTGYVTPGSGWTEISEIGSGGGSLQTQYRPPGSTATTVLRTVSGGAKACGQAFEILEAGGGGPPSPKYTELEWSVGLQSPAADTDVYEFRVYYDGASTPLDTYAVTPQLTAVSAGGVNATATPAVIARSVTVPAVTTSAGSGATTAPAVIARSVAVPAVTSQAGSTVTPAVIARSVVIDQAVASAASAGTAAPAVIVAATTIGAITPGVTANPFYVQGVYVGDVGVTSPTATFTNPVQTGDLIYFFMGTASQTVTIASVPAGWVNVLGGTTNVASAANAGFAIYHIVTAGENGTTTFTATGLFGSGAQVSLTAAVIRNVDPTTPIDGFATTFNDSLITTHVLPSITGTGSALDNDSLVVRAIAKDTGTFGYGSGATDHITRLASTAQSPAVWLGTRNALTTANTDVTATNIISSAADESVSISVAFTKIPTATPATAAPAVITSITTMTATTTQAGSTTSPTVIARSVVIDQVTASAAAAGTAAPAVIARSVVIGAVTTAAGSSTSPMVIARSVVIGQAVGQASKTTSPVVIARSVVIGQATPSTTVGGTAAPAVIARVVAIPTVTTQAGSKALPSVIALSVTLPAPFAGTVAPATATPATITLTLVMPAPHAVGAGVYALYVGANPVTAAYLGGLLIDGNNIHLNDAVGLFAAATSSSIEELAVALLAMTGLYYGPDPVEAVYVGDALVANVHVGAS